MKATISADIVSSTSMTAEEIIEINQKIKKLLLNLENLFPGFWGRQIKGDYLECYMPDASCALRIALIIKSYLKTFEIADKKSLFKTYGIRIAIGIGKMRIVDFEQNILDGEAIYLSGRKIEEMKILSKGTLSIEINNEKLQFVLDAIASLTDALVNRATARQCEVIYYKLLSKNETEIANILGIKQSVVNQHSGSSAWNSIDKALRYFEQVNFSDYE